MANQRFQDVRRVPPLADLTAVTATTETGLWLPAAFSAIGAGEPDVGSVYHVRAGGIVSTAATGTLIITPRYGLTTAGTVLGASAAQTATASITNQPWFLEFVLVFRSVSSAASASVCVGTGHFHSQGTLATAGGGWTVPFGGTTATVDSTIASGIFIGWTLSVAGSVTPKWITMSSLN